MNLKLESILPNEDRGRGIFSSPDCQNLLDMWQAFYPKIGFTPPWNGYFIKDGERIVGSCALIKVPNGESAEISYWTFGGFEGKGIAT